MAFDIGALLGRMRLDRSGFSANIKAAEAELKGFSTKGVSSLKVLGLAFAGVTAAVSGVVAGLTYIVKKTADYGDEIAKLSARTRMSAEDISAMGHVLNLADSSLNDLAQAYRALTMQQSAAMRGSKEAREAFKGLGIDWVDSAGKGRPFKDMLFEIMDAMKRAEDATEAEGYAMTLLGRGMMSLLPAMRGGSEEFKRGMAEARRYGLVIGDQFAKDAEEFNDSMSRIKASVAGIVYAIGGQLVPEIQPMLEDLAEWIASNRTLIAQDVKGWIAGVTTGLTGMGPALHDTVEGVKTFGEAWEVVSGVVARVYTAVAGTINAAFYLSNAFGKKVENTFGFTLREMEEFDAVQKHYAAEMKKNWDFTLTGEWFDRATPALKHEVDVNLKHEFEITVDASKVEEGYAQVMARSGEVIAEKWKAAMLAGDRKAAMAISRGVDQGLMGR